MKKVRGKVGKIPKVKTEINWIYNIVDRFNSYPYKHPYLERFLEYIEEKNF